MSLKLFVFIIIVNLSFAKTFTIIGTPTKPFKINEAEGISIDILKLVMKDIGIEDYKFEFYPTVTRVIKEAQLGNADMLIGYSKNRDRLSYLAYPQESYRRIKWNFFIRKEDEGKITYDTFEDLKPYTVGVTKDVSYTKEFWNAESFLTFDYAVRNNLQIRKLIGKRFDLVPLNTRSTLYEAKIDGTLDKISYLKKPIKDKSYFDPICINSDYFSQNNGELLTNNEQIKIFLDKYDNAIKKLKKNGTIDNIYKKYGYEYQLK